ncbi:hypothetical protein LOZ62_001367 [Ophidiomyces ophidiicola]|nr:hypothetical protein LOZ62_001367 [Ophidiomyces ophidiicola]
MVSNPDATDYEAEAFEDARDDIPTPLSASRSLTDRRPSIGSLPTPKATAFPPLDSSDKTEPAVKDLSSPQSREGTPKTQKQPKSPLLTAHRLSTSSLDDVNLSGSKDGETADSPASHVSSSGNTPPSLPSRDSKPGSRLQNLSASLPSVPWGPPPVNKSLPPQPAAPPTRKLTSPFSWLSRGQNTSKESKTLENRRNTGASVSTILSNPEMAHRSEGSDGDAASTESRRQLRNSLKDQFKLLRMREEGSVEDQAAVVSESQDEKGQSTLSPPSSSLDVDSTSLPSPVPGSPLPPTANPNLAPGTVSGFSASATDAAAPVDWELWQQIVNHGPDALNGSNAEELNVAIRRGIPQTIRGVIWQVLADSRSPDLEDVYRELCARGTDKERERYWSPPSANGHANGNLKDKDSTSSSRSSVHSNTSTAATSSTNIPAPSVSDKETEATIKAQADSEETRKKKAKEDAAALVKLEKAIRRDLGSRTSYSKYFMSQRNQEALFNVCKAYALYDSGVGYAQGMNFIVMPLLFNLDDGEAFTLLVKLMNKYDLRSLFIHDMPGLHRHLYQFERLLEDLEPALTCHLRRRGVGPQLYATQWFLTLFAYRFPLQLVLRVYDLIFEQGLESAILRFAVAIMRRNVDALLSMNDMTTLTSFLKEKIFDVYIDKQPSPSSILESGFFGSSGASDKEIYRADIMVEDACAITLTPEMIHTYTSEWEEKTRAEKDLATEIEGYKHSIVTQSARIRSLEEHAEKSDTEHVQIASELVRIKVENEELKDTNESLKLQVTDLKDMVDRQPAELEEKLRTELDRIMKRNIEVQNENRAMEEQMTEMEKDLVEAKMKWAEISENYDTLKQKWSDLRKALDG